MERRVTLRRVTALHRYWGKSPRTEWLMAAQVGWARKKPAEKRGLDDLFRQLGVQPGEVYRG